jgi:hypothetical protein
LIAEVEHDVALIRAAQGLDAIPWILLSFEHPPGKVAAHRNDSQLRDLVRRFHRAKRAVDLELRGSWAHAQGAAQGMVVARPARDACTARHKCH